MTHRLAHLGAGWYWVLGVSSWVAAKASVWAQAAANADPPSMTEALSNGGLAISSGAIAMGAINLARFIVTTMKDNADAARKERDRIRDAEQADKDRASREAQAARDHDARLAEAEAQIEASKREIAAANERARVAEEEARKVKEVVDGVRERRHEDVKDQNRYMLGTGLQVKENTAAFNQLRVGVAEMAKRLGMDVGIPAPVEPILSEIPPPVAHIEPLPSE